jgi:hypothetical protein
MALLRRVLLPALIALMVLSQVVVGVAGAADLRADHRRTAALAKEKSAVVGYRAEVAPLITQVFDAVQPLQDIEDAFAHPAPGMFAARNDVLARGGATPLLAATSTALAGVRVPQTLRGQAHDLTTALAGFATAASSLSDATRAKGDSTGFVSAFSTGYDALQVAELTWVAAVTGMYGAGTTLPTPAEDRGGAHGRKVATHASYLQQADLICGRGEQDLLAVGDITDQALSLKNLQAEAAIIIRIGVQLRAVRTNAASAGYAHRAQVLLSGAASYPTALLAAVRAYRAHDRAGLIRAQATLLAALPTLRDLSRTFKAYGATLCSRAYNVDGLLNRTGGKGSGGLST